MAHGDEQTLKGDRKSTKRQEERHLRQAGGDVAGERGAMPDTPDQEGVGPDAAHTADPRPYPTSNRRSGPERKFTADE